MVNEDIITSLKNAIERGESLETAMAIAINSGYNPREVKEAARFIGEGVIGIEKISQEQLLAVPNERRLFSKILSPRKTGTFIPLRNENIIPNATQPRAPQKQQLFTPDQPGFYAREVPQIQKPILPPTPVAPVVRPQQQVKPLPQPQATQQIKQDINQNIPVPTPIKIEPPTPVKFRPPRQSYLKEIILLIILLVLVGILIITFKFRDQIVTFFGG